MAPLMARVCVVTAGQLSTCPRMLKAADALAQAGYRVRLVSARHTDWADETDRDARGRRSAAWDWTAVDHRRQGPGASPLRYAWSGARRRGATTMARLLGPRRAPLAVGIRAYSREHSGLVAAALAEPVDLFYGGTTGALAAVAEAGRRAGVPFGLDLEDFHPAEHAAGQGAGLAHALADRILRDVLPRARFLTASSEAIAAAYAERYGVRARVVHNTFPLPPDPPVLEPSPGEGLRLYWFSQTIGPGRGLEDVVRAAGLAEIPVEMHLRGRALPDYVRTLERLAEDRAPLLKLVVHSPAPPDAMVALCAGYDVGLAVESPHVLNHDLCASNKSYTYLLAGLAVVLTDTAGQRPLAADLGEGAFSYRPGDVGALAAGLRRWAEDKTALGAAKAAAWRAAGRRWHWEHPAERGALLATVEGALP
jgi:glycosyltransferase involved in cell wall biosynthesis